MNLYIYSVLKHFIFAVSLTSFFMVVYVAMGIWQFHIKERYKSFSEKDKHVGKYLVKVFYYMGLITVMNICLKFTSTYIMVTNGAHDLFDSVIFINSLRNQTVFPFSSLIVTMTACSALYTGFEGATSVLTNMKEKSSVTVQMPLHKRRRVMFMLKVWFFIACMSALFNFLSGGETDIYYLGETFTGLGITATAMFAADRAPKVAAQVNMSDKGILNTEEPDKNN